MTVVYFVRFCSVKYCSISVTEANYGAKDAPETTNSGHGPSV